MTNHPKDRHVLAAAVRASAEVIVTSNLSDLPVPEILVLLQRTDVPRFAAEVRRHLGPPARQRSRPRRLKAGINQANGLAD
jgi:hypothetical protein